MLSSGPPVPTLQLSHRRIPTLLDEEDDEEEGDESEARKYSIAMDMLLEKDMNNEVALLQKELELEQLHEQVVVGWGLGFRV